MLFMILRLDLLCNTLSIVWNYFRNLVWMKVLSIFPIICNSEVAKETAAYN